MKTIIILITILGICFCASATDDGVGTKWIVKEPGAEAYNHPDADGYHYDQYIDGGTEITQCDKILNGCVPFKGISKKYKKEIRLWIKKYNLRKK